MEAGVEPGDTLRMLPDIRGGGRNDDPSNSDDNEAFEASEGFLGSPQNS